MNVDANNVSNRNQNLVTVLCLLYGSLGAHRFYVGKYKSGLLFLLLGSLNLALNLLGFNFAFISSILFAIAIVHDLFALFSKRFTDRTGKVVLSNKHRDKYYLRTQEEKFDDNLNTVICILVFFIILTTYAITKNYIL